MKNYIWVTEQYFKNKWNVTDGVFFTRKEARQFCKANPLCNFRYRKYVTEQVVAPEPPFTRYNINDMVMVYLTSEGAEELMNYNIVHAPISTYQTIPTGYNPTTRLFKTELWNLMLIFGRFLYMGGRPMFIQNIICIKKD
jgi:hypothetical protein